MSWGSSTQYFSTSFQSPPHSLCHRKNAFTPLPFSSESFIITLPDEDTKPAAPKPTVKTGGGKGGKRPAPAPASVGDELNTGEEDDESKGRRFKIVIKSAASIDLAALAKFCRGEKQSSQVEELMVGVWCRSLLSLEGTLMNPHAPSSRPSCR